MFRSNVFRVGLCFGCVVAVLSAALACAGEASRPLVEWKPGIERQFVPQYGVGQQAVAALSQDSAAPGLVLTFSPGKSAFPGMGLKPAGIKAWDLSAFGHIEARVTNLGDAAASLSLRVDNEGDWRAAPWNTESIKLQPHETGTIKVIFGHQFGHKPGYALKPAEIVGLVFFTDKCDAQRSFRVESLVAAGLPREKPPVDPATVRTKPRAGVLLGADAPIDPKTQVEAKGAGEVKWTGAALRVELPAAKGSQMVRIKPAQGFWDLCEATEVRIRLRNAGQTPFAPNVFLQGKGGVTPPVSVGMLGPGASREIVIPFAAAVPGKGVAVSRPGSFGNQPQTGTSFTSESTSAVALSVWHEGAGTLQIESIVAVAVPAELPTWLGRRPPATGDWEATFAEEFDGPAIDQRKWNIYGPNWWDRATHWSKDNLLLQNGQAVLHFEKKRGFHNDNSDPKVVPENLTRQKVSDYACGYLDTLGKWRQRYGYFEARVKLPRAAGLWPTFWMMPDRGPNVPHAQRSDTGDGGMELDIMEHLTRWGPHRYNIAVHFDGYGKQHKSVGSSCNYVPADKDGYITSGLLWLPGSVVFYGNGLELWRWDDPRAATVPAYFIIEFTTGGWDNDPVDDTQLPADYCIDYVRVWQRKDLASGDDGFAPASKTEK